MGQLISKEVLQELYLRGTNDAVKSALKSYTIRYFCNKVELEEALTEALEIFGDENKWSDDFATFVRGTRFERGEILEDKYGKNKYYPLPFWIKWKLKKNNEYQELPKWYPLYWIFLIVPIMHWYTVEQIEEYKKEILEVLMN